MLKEINFVQVNEYMIFYMKCIFVYAHTHDKGGGIVSITQ